MRTLQAQLQDIADWIAGMELDPEPTVADFAEGALQAAWRAVHSRAWTEDPYSFKMACLAEMVPAMAGYPNGPALCERIKRVIPSSKERPFPSLEEIADTLQPVSWLWQPWLPLGMITLLAAQQGTGKSMLALGSGAADHRGGAVAGWIAADAARRERDLCGRRADPVGAQRSGGGVEDAPTAALYAAGR